MKKKKIPTLLISIVIIVCLAISSIFVLAYKYLNYESKNGKVSIKISEAYESESDVYNSIKQNCSQYIDDKPLTMVTTTICNDHTQMEFYFIKYVNNFAEGGRIESSEITVDFNNKTVESINYFNGSSKQYGVTVTPITDFSSLNYQTAVNNYKKSDYSISDDTKLIIEYTENSVIVY